MNILMKAIGRKLKKAAQDTAERKLATGEYVMHDGSAIPKEHKQVSPLLRKVKPKFRLVRASSVKLGDRIAIARPEEEISLARRDVRFEPFAYLIGEVGGVVSWNGTMHLTVYVIRWTHDGVYIPKDPRFMQVGDTSYVGLFLGMF